MAGRAGRGTGDAGRDLAWAVTRSRGAATRSHVPRPASRIPLVRRFPALAAIPRVALGSYPTPVERIDAGGLAGPLWVKRDDLSAPEFGGNKVRSLEFLLAGVGPGDAVLTLGGDGSTHVLATAAHARRLGAVTRAVRWRHEMSPVAAAVAERARALCGRLTTLPGPVTGMLAAALARLASGAHYIPLGGSTPLGILGHVNGALELAEQVAAGVLPRPARVVVPLGSGGTAAGLALGFWIAGLDAVVVGARVAPRVGSNRWRVRRLARATAALIARATGEPISAPPPSRVEVVHDVYGGAYGRRTGVTDEAAAVLWNSAATTLDATYSAKAFAAALAIARRSAEPTLFWLTFDGRWMQAGTGNREPGTGECR